MTDIPPPCAVEPPNMLAPWEKYPAIPLGSAGWRMGHGEEYWFEFARWLAGLQPDARRAYAEKHLEPTGWSGFYARQASAR